MDVSNDKPSADRWNTPVAWVQQWRQLQSLLHGKYEYYFLKNKQTSAFISFKGT